MNDKELMWAVLTSKLSPIEQQLKDTGAIMKLDHGDHRVLECKHSEYLIMDYCMHDMTFSIKWREHEDTDTRTV